MIPDEEAFTKYREGKASLDELLRERDGLLESLEVLIEHARDLSTSDTIVKFDGPKAQGLCTALTDVEKRIETTIADVNPQAERCGEKPIRVQAAESESYKTGWQKNEQQNDD